MDESQRFVLKGEGLYSLFSAPIFMLRSPLIIALPMLLALSCTVSQEQVLTFSAPEEIRFEILDAIDHSFEGSDTVRIKTTEGEIQEATFYSKSYPFILNFAPRDMTSLGNGIFETSLDFDARQVQWYIAASSGLGASTTYGTFNHPKVAEKYMNRASADALIKDVLNFGLSSGANVYQTYEPNQLNATYSYVSGANTVEMDHYATFFTNAEIRHFAYGIEYSTAVIAEGNNLIPVTGANLTTERNDILAQTGLQDFGYIMISTTDRGGMEDILTNSNFFPVIAPEDASSVQFFQPIRY
jgi:hypothetical protein